MSDNDSTLRSTPAWHALQREQALTELQSTATGLTFSEAEARWRVDGPNELPRRKREGPVLLLWRQIHNPLIWVLIGAAALAFVMGKVTDGAVVLAVVVLNTLIGFVQEFRAGRAIESLSRMVPENAQVLREGRQQLIPVQELVRGDIVLLASGDRVPADMRLLEVRNLQVEEAALTGESVPSSKGIQPVDASAGVGDRTSMVFGGTVVTTGTARALVVATGPRTELGRISHLLQETTSLETPLTQQLKHLGRYITLAVVIVSALLLPLAVWRGYAWVEALLVAIALAVAAIPEGLPAIVTIALAIGVQRMARRRAIIRRLPAVETLGSTTVICTDKTGTLTRNEMTVQALWTPEGEFGVSGVGYSPEGELLKGGQPLAEMPAGARALLVASTLCNDASIQQVEQDRWKPAGDPTEGALVVAAQKLGVEVDGLRQRHTRLDSIPFESEHQYMATLNEGFEDGRRILLKGAPEVVLRHCDPPLGHSRAKLLETVERLASRGMRVLAVAQKRLAGHDPQLSQEAVAEGSFQLLGFQGMIDPPRPEAIESVRACHSAGIAVKMITGDHRLTAQAIGEELGLGGGPAITGSELATHDDEQLAAAVARTNVFARVAPEHKIRLVRVLQRQRHVVAMTGDGVNDAPALKQSNIGVAMGITGTAVAKESAAIILTDDNFASIAAAVEEGRRVYDNLIKSFAFVLPTNLGLALVLMVAVAFFPIERIAGELVPLMPLMPRQILWINLVGSVALSIPLAFEVAERDVMGRPPRASGEPIFGRFIIVRTAIVATLMAAGAIGLFLWEYGGEVRRVGHDVALAEAQTMAVTTIVMFQIFYMLNCRSLRESAWKIGLFTNPAVFIGIGALVVLQLGFIYLPFMQQLFGTAALAPEAFGLSVLVGAIILPVIGVEKRLLSRRSRREPPRGGAVPRAPHLPPAQPRPA